MTVALEGMVAAEPLLCAIRGEAAQLPGVVRVDVVGGWVRDRLLGLEATGSPDVDVRISGVAPGDLAERLVVRLGGRATRTPDFPTAQWQSDDGSARVDIAGLRSETYPKAGAPPVVAEGSEAEDLARRDFSVNALAYRLWPMDGAGLIDLCGGTDDLRSGVLRILHPASFRDDPTRVIRAARYAARLGLSLDSDTRRALATLTASTQTGASPIGRTGSRLRSEWGRLLEEDDPSEALSLLCEWDATWLVGLSGLDPTRPSFGRFAQILGAGGPLSEAAREPLRALALLGGDSSCEECISWFEFPSELAGRLRGLVSAPALWDGPLLKLLESMPGGVGMGGGSGEPPVLPLVLRLPLDSLARSIPPESRLQLRLVAGAFDALLGGWDQQIRPLPPLLSGDDLLAQGWLPGPQVGAALRHVRDLQLTGAVTTCDAALDTAEQWRAERES